jgi:hypothetical protein
MEYFKTEDSSVTPSYSTSGWTTTAPTTHTFDNGTNEQKTVYIFARDKAGNVSSSTSASIVFDNSTPVIDNLTLAPDGFHNWGTAGVGGAPTSGDVDLYLSAHDNDTTDNFSSGWKEFCVVYQLERTQSGTSTTVIDNGSSLSDCSWTTTGMVSSDNISFDNLSLSITLTPLVSTGGVLDNRTSGNTDNLTVRVWMRDNASNTSNEFKTVFTLDNQTINYNP